MLRTLAVLLLLIALPLVALVRPPEPELMVGGIQVNEPDHAAWLAALERAGLNTVAVTVYAKQGDWDSANLWWEEEEPWVVAEIRAAEERGLRTVLILRVALDHAFERNKFFWHGMIQPATEAEIDEWFTRYRRFAGRWAAIAEAEGVDVLAVASELNALTNTVPLAELPALEEYWSNEEKVTREHGRLLAHLAAAPERLVVRGHPDYDALAPYLDDRAVAHRDWARRVAWLDDEEPLTRINERRAALDAHWRRVVAAARAAYSGPLTYAANFDQYTSVGFWEALDLVGINAYFPLRRRELPGLAGADLESQLAAGWRRVLSGVDGFRRARGLDDRRVLFTEIGYVARANATLRPWAADGVSVERSGAGERLVSWADEPPDRAERTAAVSALRRVHREMGGELLAGLLYWKLSTDPGHRDIEPFVLVLEQGAGADPLLTELARFNRRPPLARLRLGLSRLLTG
jgi:hypothetical protein